MGVVQGVTWLLGSPQSGPALSIVNSPPMSAWGVIRGVSLYSGKKLGTCRLVPLVYGGGDAAPEGSTTNLGLL